MNGYRNPAVEAALAGELGIDLAAAGDVFQQLLQFLDGYWLARDFRSPTPEVDAAWHMFIVDTRAYMAYCEARFGAYIHHDPEAGVGDPTLARCGPGMEALADLSGVERLPSPVR